MKLLLFSSFCLLHYLVDARSCTHSLQCGRGFHCNDGICRRDSCTSDSHCHETEKCKSGKVNGRQKLACFLDSAPRAKSGGAVTEHYCPGGGAVVLTTTGNLASCDLTQECSSTHVCNPEFGICCTKVRSCPGGAKTMLNFITSKPIMCQFKKGRVMPCPKGGYCETETGFCCSRGDDLEVPAPVGAPEPVATRERPWRGQVCSPRDGCSGGAACICGSRGTCICECATEFGYTAAADGKTCQRVRRRLKEKCKTDMECSSAFSECSSGGCRCKRGFQRDGDGGCKPVEYRCVNRGTPLKKNEKLVTCSLRASVALGTFRSLKSLSNETSLTEDLIGNSTFADFGNGRDDCPDEHYCVPVFDDATKPGYYQGFCCPSPSETKPVCPVGEAHDSSFPPDFGCRNCPSDYFCHRDSVATDKSICCPKPCVSLEDIYDDGQCYPMAFYGDSCTLSAQCVYSKSPAKAEEYAELARMECRSAICSCPAGFSYADGQCKRIMCSVGLRGEPSVDQSGLLIRCGRSSDCSLGHMCDPNNHVCCKGTNRCPKDYVETGELCTDDNCRGVSQICHLTKNGKAKICCTLDDTYT
ncbi:unnamed protein product [Caenorhabditis auriculariae]|uniref:EB domain-containing protein n=1 Tax=Caenorhabditis auriculariae TaxID=2777116 RepID=A0A8S1HWN2_9PELO|nr:unnamed protein product [Caenorhabditis auriculariae]